MVCCLILANHFTQQDLSSSSSCDAEEADMFPCLKELFKVPVSQTIFRKIHHRVGWGWLAIFQMLTVQNIVNMPDVDKSVTGCFYGLE